MKKAFGVLACVAVLLLCEVAFRLGGTAALGRDSRVASETSCDYSCLMGVMEQYLKALASHDPSQIVVADQVKFTENTIPLRLGSALWGTMSGLGTYSLHFADPQAGQIGFEGTIRENGLRRSFWFGCEWRITRSVRSKRWCIETRRMQKLWKSSVTPMRFGCNQCPLLSELPVRSC